MSRRQTGLARRPQAGFTLMEVLLAVLIMGMMLTSITQLLTMVRKTRDTVHNLQENQLVGPAVLDLVERDLRGILTTSRHSPDLLRVEDRVLNGLDADSIDFACTTNSILATLIDGRMVQSDYNEVGYRLRESGGSDDFLEIHRREGFGIDDEPLDGGRYIFLHDQVKGFNIEVFAEDGPEAEPLTEWGTDPGDAETQGLPARIEISLTLELSPRLGSEKLPVAVFDKRTLTYKRIIRLPEVLRVAPTQVPVLAIPGVPQEEPEGGPGQAGNPDDTTGGAGGGGGGGGATSDIPGSGDDKRGAGGGDTTQLDGGKDG